jgi:hypothetical protein
MSKQTIRRRCYALSAAAALLVLWLKSTIALAVGLWLLIGGVCLAAPANYDAAQGIGNAGSGWMIDMCIEKVGRRVQSQQ